MLTKARDYGIVLKHVPMKFRDKEMCMEAIKKDSLALIYVPEKLKNREMCMQVIKHTYPNCEYSYFISPYSDNYDLIIKTSAEFLNEEDWLELLKESKKCLKYIPIEMAKKQSIMEIIKEDTEAYKYLSKELFNELAFNN